jgi:CDP-diacylglycerol--glycerol-3-phosphate 3-phosphatidyltransferase
MTARRELFQWLLLACLLSDILDGLIARMFHLSSRLGAFLDSIADMLVTVIAVLGLFVFQKKFLAAHVGPLTVVVVLYAIEMLAALVRYGRLSSFHTVLVRVAAYLQGIFIMSLFLWGYGAGLFYAMVAISVVAYAEELVLLYVLPKWTADVRGLYWVLYRRGAS